MTEATKLCNAFYSQVLDLPSCSRQQDTAPCREVKNHQLLSHALESSFIYSLLFSLYYSGSLRINNLILVNFLFRMLVYLLQEWQRSFIKLQGMLYFYTKQLYLLKYVNLHLLHKFEDEVLDFSEVSMSYVNNTLFYWYLITLFLINKDDAK